MKFELPRTAFEAVLAKASVVLSTKDLLPLLKNVNITVAEGSLRVVATDIELSVIAKTSQVNCLVPGSALFPGRKLLEIVKACEAAPVTVTVSAEEALVACAGATWNVQLMHSKGYPEFPALTDVNAATVPRAAFVNALLKVKGAAAKEGVRPALQMVDIRDGNVRASDGAIFRQVHIAELKGHALQIPLSAVEELVKLLRSSPAEQLTVGQTEDHLLFTLDGNVFIITKTTVDYPDVEGLLLEPARANTMRLTVDRQQLIAGIKRVRINADEDTKGVVFVLGENDLTLRAHDKSGFSADQRLTVHYLSSPRSFGVNHENLLDTLQALDTPSVTLLLGADTRARKAPLLVDDGSVIAVLQQLKLIL
jgi:DNA polymerase-3 subunit beta